jgi:hypothetical protein
MQGMASCTAIVGFVILALRVEEPVRLAPTERAVMLQEVDALWRPYGVAIVDASRSPDSCLDAAVRLTVIVARSAAASGAGHVRRLGAIVFDERDRPADSLTLDAAGVAEIVSRTRPAGQLLNHWPTRLGDQATGRALGRVLAHEIGHYLLASRQHAAGGLMRSAFAADELIAPDRRTFAIAPLYLRRLSASLARLAPPIAAAGVEP